MSFNKTRSVFDFRLEGLTELDQSLGELSKVTARRVGRRALTKAGEIIRDKAAGLAPDDPATGSPDLHTSIVVSARLKDRRGLADYANEMLMHGNRALAGLSVREARRAGGKDTVMTMAVGPANMGTKRNPARYAHLVEFGTVHSAAQPFMTPAWESTKQTALTEITNQLRIEIGKAAARAARRRAKGTGGTR